MDCRIIDNKAVLRDGSAVSVPPNHFDDAEWIERYYGVVLKLIQNGKQAWVQWIEDNAKSIEDRTSPAWDRNTSKTEKVYLTHQAQGSKWWCSIWNAKLGPQRFINPM